MFAYAPLQCRTVAEYRDQQAQQFLDKWLTALHFIGRSIPTELKSVLRTHVPSATPFNRKALSEAVLMQTALNPAIMAEAFQLDAGNDRTIAATTNRLKG